ncbi:unnamed protein product [Rotaria sp. Silwood1]|nr:unnamed protein product [Rotaria sp. Silwood1]
MKSIVFLLELFIYVQCEITYIEVKYPLKGEHSPPNAIWPHPQQINASNELLYIRPHAIMIHSNIQTCDIITKAIQRYEPIFFPPKLSMRDPPSGDVHRCRLLRRGIPAQPILTGYCGNYELGMPESMINDPAFNYETSTTINSTTISTQSSTTSYLSNSAPSIIVSISANLIIIMGITLTAFSF